MEIVFLLLGLFFLGIGIFLIADHARFLSSSRTITGRVIAMEKRTTPPDGSRKEGGPIYYPVVEYSIGGTKREFTSNYGSNLPTRDIGEKVSVVYSRNRSEARIRSVAPFVMGSVFGAIGQAFVSYFSIFFNFPFLR